MGKCLNYCEESRIPNLHLAAHSGGGISVSSTEPMWRAYV